MRVWFVWLLYSLVILDVCSRFVILWIKMLGSIALYRDEIGGYLNGLVYRSLCWFDVE